MDWVPRARVAILVSALLLSGAFVAIPPPTNGLTPHAPIGITSNGGFTLPSNGVTGGSGTPADPYIIEGWDINASTGVGIYIQDTDAHYVLRDLDIHADGANTVGIWLSNTSNGRMENVTARDGEIGALLQASANWTFSNNTFQGNSWSGLYVSVATNLTIVDNYAQGNGQRGLDLLSCTNLTVERNQMEDNREGLSLWSPENATAQDNTAVRNSAGGISAYRANATRIRQNVIVGSAYGVSAQLSTNLTIESNTIRDSAIHGVHDTESTGTVIRNNTLWNNNWSILVSLTTSTLIEGNTVTLSNLSAIMAASSDDVVIRDNLVSVAPNGIVLSNTRRATVENNTVQQASASSLYVSTSDRSVLRGNHAADSGDWGLELVVSTNATLTQNQFTRDSIYIWGFLREHYSAHDILPDNLVNGRPVLYYKDCNGVVVDGVPVGELIVANCTAFQGSNLAVVDADLGVELAYVEDTALDAIQFAGMRRYGLRVESSRNVSVRSSQFDNNTYMGASFDGASRSLLEASDFSASQEAVHLVRTDNVTLNGNRILSGGLGVDTMWSENVTLENNTVSNQTVAGFWSGAGRDLVIRGNRLQANEKGVYVWGTENIAVSGNNISESNQTGFDLRDSQLVTIENNTFQGSGDTGLFLEGTQAVAVFSNEFLSNVRHAFDSGGNGNLWNAPYPLGGNYWSGYSGPDACSGVNQDVCTGGDGFGDIVYVVTSGWAIDRYPILRNQRPVAAFSVTPGSGNVTTDFTADAGASWDPEDGTAGLGYRWDWEDDGTWDVPFSPSITATHRYPSPGNYTIRLEVHDAPGLRDDTIRFVSVGNTPPTAVVTVSPLTGTIATEFAFNASMSVDLEDSGSALLFRWDWENDGTWDTAWGNTGTASLQFSSPGFYSVRVAARDAAGLDNEAVAAVEVTNVYPSAVFDVTPGPSNNRTRFEFNASGSSDLETAPGDLQFRWDWEDDGSWDTVFSAMPVEQHRFETPAVHRVRLEVQDQHLGRNTTTRDVSVLPDTTPPTAIITPPSDVPRVGISGVFGGEASDDDSGYIASYRWEVRGPHGVVTTGESSQFPVTFSEPGTHTVRLTVTDPEGNSDTAVMDVAVQGESSFGWIVLLVLLISVLLAVLLIRRRKSREAAEDHKGGGAGAEALGPTMPPRSSGADRSRAPRPGPPTPPSQVGDAPTGTGGPGGRRPSIPPR